MRKILAILLALCLTIGLTACSGGDSSDEATETENGSAAGSTETGLRAAAPKMN